MGKQVKQYLNELLAHLSVWVIFSLSTIVERDISITDVVVTPTAPAMTTPTVTPNATYHYPKSEIALRIGTGGSGQSGLLEALAQEFIKL